MEKQDPTARSGNADHQAIVAFGKFKESNLYTLIIQHDVTEADLWSVFYAGWKASSPDPQNYAIA